MLPLLLGLLGLAAAATARSDAHVELFVDPEGGDDGSLGAAESPLRTVHAARDTVRSLLARRPEIDVTVQLLPGVHNVGNRPLELTSSDSGRAGGVVTWRSQDPSLPAVVGAHDWCRATVALRWAKSTQSTLSSESCFTIRRKAPFTRWRRLSSFTNCVGMEGEIVGPTCGSFPQALAYCP